MCSHTNIKKKTHKDKWNETVETGLKLNYEDTNQNHIQLKTYEKMHNSTKKYYKPTSFKLI